MASVTLVEITVYQGYLICSAEFDIRIKNNSLKDFRSEIIPFGEKNCSRQTISYFDIKIDISPCTLLSQPFKKNIRFVIAR